MDDTTSNHRGDFPEVLENPVSYGQLIGFMIIRWDLQVENPAKEDIEYFIFELWSELGGCLNPIDSITQAETLGPEIEQILLNARVSSIDDCLGKGIHDLSSKLECFLEAYKLLFEPHQCLKAVSLLALLLWIFISRCCQVQQKVHDLLLLIKGNLDLAILLILHQFFQLQEALLKILID